jgi:hypothetical protein
MAGLAAARTLCDVFDGVVLLERDAIPDLQVSNIIISKNSSLSAKYLGIEIMFCHRAGASYEKGRSGAVFHATRHACRRLDTL